MQFHIFHSEILLIIVDRPHLESTPCWKFNASEKPCFISSLYVQNCLQWYNMILEQIHFEKIWLQQNSYRIYMP